MIFAMNTYGLTVSLKNGNIVIRTDSLLRTVSPEDLGLQPIINITIDDFFYYTDQGRIMSITITTEECSNIMFQVNEAGVISEGCKYSYHECEGSDNSMVSTKKKYKRMIYSEKLTFKCSYCKKIKLAKMYTNHIKILYAMRAMEQK
ncbi:MAG: hypothetical protein QS721_09850 [Candidatus Endonucleobacter sp. (ex Gigantidas childressi)]|nr:hypothetical protein [Candidatus Endonucleobacter sp. (ex Gigantidas childressi)]